jgi:hypothetical protein
MKLSTDETLELALKRLYKLNLDPDYINQVREDRARVLEYRRKNYEQKLDYWKNKSGYVVHETDGGFKAYAKNSPEGKKLIVDRIKEEAERARVKRISENPLEEAFDDICCGENPTTKINIRTALTQYTGFTLEKFDTLIKMIEDEGIDII